MSEERQSLAARRRVEVNTLPRAPARRETERSGTPAAGTDISRFAFFHAGDVMRLQHALGNQAVGRLIDTLGQAQGRLLVQRFTEDDVRKRIVKVRQRRLHTHPVGNETLDQKKQDAKADRAQAQIELKEIEKIAHEIAEIRRKKPSQFPKWAGPQTDWSVAEHEIDLRANFNAIAGGSVAEAGAPSEIALPPTLASGMSRAMKRSFPKGKSLEQGGILVRNKDGSYDFKPGQATDSGEFEPNYEDTGEDQQLVGSAHTHPYSKAEGGYTDVSFSPADIYTMIDSGEKVAFLQSGKTQFAISTTAEWDAMLKPLKTPQQKRDLTEDIVKTWTDARAAAKGTFSERVEAGVKAVCAKFHLVYYRGKLGTLTKQ